LLGLPGVLQPREYLTNASKSHRLYVALGIALPVLIAFAADVLGVDPPFALAKSDVGTVWQVEGALVGLAIALVLFGYEALGRGGPIEPFEIRELWLPRTIYLGLSLVALTGLAVFVAPDPGAATGPFSGWLAVGAVLVGALWLGLLVTSIPELVRVTDVNYRTGLRLRRIEPLARVAVETRLVELASTHVIREALRPLSTLDPYFYPDSRDASGRVIQVPVNGVIRDVHLGRLGRFASDAHGLTIRLGLGQRLESGQPIGRVAADVPDRVVNRWHHMLDIARAGQPEPLQRLLETLHDSCIGAIASKPSVVGDVLDAYARCLEVFAETWNVRAGEMALEQLREPLAPDTTPLGRIVDSVAALMETAVRAESREAIIELGRFPSRVARIGLENNSSAYLSALELSLRFYSIGTRDPQSRESGLARARWEGVVSFLQWTIPIAARRFDRAPSMDLLRQADNAARRTVVGLARAMFVNRDLEQYTALLGRVAELRDD
jgi:hypothetical protein